MTESRRLAGGDVGGGDRGFEDADVATAKATAAVDVLLLDRAKPLVHSQKERRKTIDRLDPNK